MTYGMTQPCRIYKLELFAVVVLTGYLRTAYPSNMKKTIHNPALKETITFSKTANET